MKFRKIIIATILLIIMIGISTNCYAKYVFDYIENAVEVNVDRTSPILKVEYSNTEVTNTEVEVKIIANEEIKEVNGWKLSEDRKTLSKIYEENINEVITVEDLSGNQSQAQIWINNIDKKPPIAKIIEISNTNLGYEKYANKTHEIILKVKVFDDNEIIRDNSKDFLILVGTKEADCTKEVEMLEKNRNYITYQIRLTNILENGRLTLKILGNTFEDIVGNKMSEKTLKTEIEIDNISPTVEYSQQILENGKILAKINSNEKTRKLDGWNLDDSQTISSKEFISNIKYQREVIDFAGNASKVDIKIEESTFLGLEVKAHMSRSGEIEANNNIIGRIEANNTKYKFESLLFRTSQNVESDFLKVSGYVHTYWGPDSYAKSGRYGVVYNYGYNPLEEYKTMANSELVTNNGKQYIHLGGEGVNYHGETDINGNNPIPMEIASQYNYGVSGIKLDLKSHRENSIIYQIFFDDTGWLKTCKNGEEAMRETNQPIEAIRFAVIPTSELEFVIQYWDKDIGTYNID